MIKFLLSSNAGNVTGPTAKPNSDVFFIVLLIIIAIIVTVSIIKNTTPEKNKKTKKESKTIIRCKKCGAQIDNDSEFCKSCGAKQNDEPIKNFCPKCGAPITNQIKCDNCNNILNKKDH